MRKLFFLIVLTFSLFAVKAQSNITAIKYWIDNNLSSMSIINGSYGSVANISENLNIGSNLNSGFHTITLQFKQTDGKWSVPIAEPFFYTSTSGNQAMYEYWFDDDFVNKKQVEHAGTTNFILNNQMLNSSALPNGFHRLNIRFRSTGGLWSVPVTESFFKRGNDIVPAMDVTKIRYWFDNESSKSRTIKFRNLPNTSFTGLFNAEKLSEGNHVLKYMFCDNGGIWSSEISEPFERLPITDIKLLFPGIRIINNIDILSTSLLKYEGDKFVPLGDVKLIITNESDPSFRIDLINSANQDGKIAGQYQLTSSFKNGYYNIIGLDMNNEHYTNVARFLVSDNKPFEQNLSVNYPKGDNAFEKNQQFNLRWIDKINVISTNLLNGTGNFLKKYIVEFSKDNGPWFILPNGQSLYQKYGFANTTTEFTLPVSLPNQGFYRVRITDFDQPLSQTISESFEIKDVTNLGFYVRTEWDFSGARSVVTKPSVLAADGVSRMYLVVRPKPNINKLISQVDVQLSDDHNSSSSVILGKVMPALTIDTYSTEANGALSTTVSSGNNVNGDVWFWYVAPDDFCRVGVDESSSKRFVTAQFHVTYTDGSQETISDYPIEIVRPPLMLVHGLGGSEHTWDNFKYTDIVGTSSYSVKFKDNLVKWVIGVQANNMLPNARFISNARKLLNLNPDSGVPNNNFYDPNSFQSMIHSARAKGFCVNRIDYVCHSMGGNMARTALNELASEYKVESSIGYRQIKNYGKGFINKFISLNTPHNGSPFADFLVDLPTEENVPLRYLLEFAEVIDKDNKMTTFFENDGTRLNDNFYHYNPTNAVLDLQSFSAGVKFNSTYVKNHLIAGKFSAPNKCAEVFIDVADRMNTNPIVAYVKAIIDIYSFLHNDDWVGYQDNEFNISDNTIRSFSTTICKILQKVGERYGDNEFNYNSDLIVPLKSQLAGLDENYNGHARTIFSGFDYNHVSITDQLLVGNRVYSLLNCNRCYLI